MVKYYYLPAFHETGPALELMINKELYDGLDDDLQQIVRFAAMASATESLADFTFHNAESLRPLLAEEGVELRTWSDEVSAALAEQSEIVLEELAATSDLAGEVHASFMEYRQKAAEFARVSDQRMLEMRSQALGL